MIFSLGCTLLLPSWSFGDHRGDGEDTILAGKRHTVNQSTDTKIRFGVYTSDKPTEMYRVYKPFINYLHKQLKNQKLNYDIELKVYSSYNLAIDALIIGDIDFVRFGPASYILAKSHNKNLRLLAMEHKKGKKRFYGVFIVAKNSTIQSINELKNKTFAFGNKNSTIGRYLSQAELLKVGISSTDLAGIKYLGRHDKVALAVAAGNYDAGVVKESTYNKYKKKLRIIGKFPNVTKPWVASAKLDNTIFFALKKILLELKNKEILKILKKDGFLEATDLDYDFIRKEMQEAKQF
ncbi:MAG: phosphate/phosphite/phosphonate ABC transporter substrate-binding protein [Desulfobacteraceae bacterium]|nr:phosphate/phosphite/phosphonate ABC transporter substrate-binding protein [Desulfobacteraceae bacterium]